MLQVAWSFGNHYKFWPDKPLGLYADNFYQLEVNSISCKMQNANENHSYFVATLPISH